LITRSGTGHGRDRHREERSQSEHCATGDRIPQSGHVNPFVLFKASDQRDRWTSGKLASPS
jgi:hypothetical protein